MLYQFALRLICGIGLSLGCLPCGAVRGGFFRVQMLVVLGLAVLAWLAAPWSPAPSGTPTGVASPVLGPGVWAGSLAGLAYIGSAVWTLEARRLGTAVLWVMTALALGALAEAVAAAPAGPEPFAWRWIGAISSAGLLGTVLTAMLLGHAYLTAPGMSLAPLQRLNSLLLGTAAMRAAYSAAALAAAWPALPWNGDRYWILWLALRWLAGIGGPLVCGGMVVNILRYRNTQSATGVLYAAVIVVLIGELTSELLWTELGRSL